MSEVREGYKMTELGEIPNDWSVKKLSDVLTIGYGKNQKEVEVKESDIPILGTGGIIGFSSKSLFDKPSVLIGRKGTIDKPRFIDKPFWTIDTLFYTDIYTDKANPKFVYYLFNNIDWYLYNEATGVPSLSSKNISSIKFAYIPLKEQQKIADILSTVDTQIEQTEQMIEQTKELKHGLMQQLLTKGIGHTEFKESELGRIPLNWHAKSLGESAIIVMGQSPKGESYNINEIGLPLLNGPTEFGEKFPTAIQWTSNPTKTCECGDILFTVRGSSIGRMNISNAKYCIGRGLAAIRQSENTITKFMNYVLQFNVEKVLKNIAGSTFPNITKDELNNFKLALPPIEEQLKISDILLTVDNQIDIYEQEKAKYEELKKGLMQQLLTGKIRVSF